MQKISVLIIDNDFTGRQTVGGILSLDPEIEIVGLLPNNKLAREKIHETKPDLVILDLCTSVSAGLETVEYIMGYSPRPVVVLGLSECKGSGNGRDIFEALELGALEVMEKPGKFTSSFRHRAGDWVKEMKLLSKVKVITHPRGRLGSPASREAGFRKEKDKPVVKMVAIAASAGGPEAIREILNNLPPKVPFPLGIVQHLPAGFIRELVAWLDATSKIKVKEAKNGESVGPDCAFVAPAPFNMLIADGGRIILDGCSPDKTCPSADIFFGSVARVYGSCAMGIVLTGMGRDGAEGLKKIRSAGGKTIAQDEKTSLIFGMPKAAIEIGAAEKILPLDLIPQEIMKE